MSEAQYAFSLTTFSPTGKLMQIEYALSAVSQGATSLGIKGAYPANAYVSPISQHFRPLRLFCCLSDLIFVDSAKKLLVTSVSAAKDGVVIASEKKLHPLVIEDTVHKIANITDNIGMVYSGIGPDFRVLVRKARKKAQEYFRYYKEQISVNRLVREVATIMQEYTQSGYVNHRNEICFYRFSFCSTSASYALFLRQQMPACRTW